MVSTFEFKDSIDINNDWRLINYIFHILKRHSGGQIKNTSKKIYFSDNEKLDYVNKISTLILENKDEDNSKIKTALGLFQFIYTEDQITLNELRDIFIRKFNIECLSDDEFRWIDKRNNQLIDYLWSYIRIAVESRDSSYLCIPEFVQSKRKRKIKIEHGTPLPVFNKLTLNHLPLDNEERYRTFIYFFDLWKIDNYFKKEQLVILKSKWLSSIMNNPMEKWAKKNKDLCEWALNYLKVNFLENKHPVFILPDSTQPATVRFSTESLVTLYNLIESVDTQDIVLSNMSRAASQYKYRLELKNNEKSHLNPPVSNETKLKFNEIKDTYNKSSEETLKMIIDYFYEEKRHKILIKKILD